MRGFTGHFVIIAGRETADGGTVQVAHYNRTIFSQVMDGKGGEVFRGTGAEPGSELL